MESGRVIPSLKGSDNARKVLMNSAKRQKAFAEALAEAGGQLKDAFVTQ